MRVQVEDGVGADTLHIGFAGADIGGAATLQDFEQEAAVRVEQGKADAIGAKAIVGQVAGLGGDEGRRGLCQALEHVFDAAVEGKGPVIGREIPGRILQYIAPGAPGGADLDLGDISNGNRREQT